MNVNNMSKQLGVVTSAVNSLTDDVNEMKSDIFELKENIEITTAQTKNINRLAKKRIFEILGDSSSLDYQKYSKIFFYTLYKDTRQNAGLGASIPTTKKCDYQRCVDYIEAWTPSCGCIELRSRADANAKARVEARKLGYLNELKRENKQ